MSAAPSIGYVLRFGQAAQHFVDVEATFAGSPARLTVRLPTWSPGSYLIREYARHLEGLMALGDGGEPLPCSKTRKDTFVIERGEANRVRVSYRIYGRELSVRTNWIDDDFALLQGTATFLYAEGMTDLPHEVTIEPPAAWRTLHAGGDIERRGPAFWLRMANYDELVDTPMLLGNARADAFDVAGVRHVLATIGGDGLIDTKTLAGDAKAIVGQNLALFGGTAPYRHYTFLNIAGAQQGGLEHRSSSVLMARPFAKDDHKARQQFAGLVSHEHFHVWNIKRLRPEALGPFDYAEENYTTSLWIAEGLTAYYDDLQACRAGVLPPCVYLEQLAGSITALQAVPGRKLTSLTRASFDAWIKLYRPDEHTDNSTVSYYLKGSLVGWLLDARLRAMTADARSLDDVMRRAFQRFSGARGYSEAEFRAVINEVAGADLSEDVASWADGVGELDYTEALTYFGLKLTWALSTPEQARFRDHHGTIGIHLREGAANAIVRHVVRDSPAWQAGLNVDDEILAVDGQRAVPTSLLASLAERASSRPEASLLLARFGRLRELPVTLRLPQPSRAELVIDSEAPAEAVQHRHRWLQSLVGTA